MNELCSFVGNVRKKKDFLEKWAIIQLSFQTTNWISSFLLFQPCFYKVRSRNWLFLVWSSFMNLRLSFVTWKKAVFFFLENKQLCSEVLNMIRGKYVSAFSAMSFRKKLVFSGISTFEMYFMSCFPRFDFTVQIFTEAGAVCLCIW